MFEGDILVDDYGNTVLDNNNNDLMVSTDDRSFIINMLTTKTGTWKDASNFGVGLADYTGYINNADTQNKIGAAVKTFFNGMGYLATVLVSPASNDSVFLTLMLIDSITGKSYQLQINFNLNSGEFNFIEKPYERAPKVANPTTVTKYSRRR